LKHAEDQPNAKNGRDDQPDGKFGKRDKANVAMLKTVLRIA
jgi:hypothetical protein